MEAIGHTLQKAWALSLKQGSKQLLLAWGHEDTVPLPQDLLLVTLLEGLGHITTDDADPCVLRTLRLVRSVFWRNHCRALSAQRPHPRASI
jgi:hypothetical protein